MPRSEVKLLCWSGMGACTNLEVESGGVCEKNHIMDGLGGDARRAEQGKKKIIIKKISNWKGYEGRKTPEKRHMEEVLRRRLDGAKASPDMDRDWTSQKGIGGTAPVQEETDTACKL